MLKFKVVLLLSVISLWGASSHAEDIDPINDKLLNQGMHQLSMRQFESAVFYLTEAIRENPKQTLAYVKRAKALLALDRYHEAMADYRKALEIDPEFVAKHFKGKKDLFNESEPVELSSPE